MTTTYVYARRRPGRCDDCGNGPVRLVRFWSTGMFYTVCQRHEEEYRYMRVLLRGSWRDRDHHDAWLAAANAAARRRAAEQNARRWMADPNAYDRNHP